MSTNAFKHAVAPFVNAGIPQKALLPIAPVDADISKNASLTPEVLGKAPGRYIPHIKRWAGLQGSIITAGVSKDDAEKFASWPTRNVGLIGRAFPAIDSDVTSEAGRKFVEKVIASVFGDERFAERVRGRGPRRLYAFRCRKPGDMDTVVRTRHVAFKLKDGSEHKVDILGYGSQYLIAGTHPSGDEYEWFDDASLADAEVVKELPYVVNDDMDQFLTSLELMLTKAGGEIIRKTGGFAGEEYDTTTLEPVYDPEVVLDTMSALTNDEATFGDREEFVSFLSALRAALGSAACEPDIEDEIREWATLDDEWCDEAYFDKIWFSVRRVRVSRNLLDMVFKRHGVKGLAKAVFKDDAKELNKTLRKDKKNRSDAVNDLFQEVSKRYRFGAANKIQKRSQPTMRYAANVDIEWDTMDWWAMETVESDRGLINDLRNSNPEYNSSKVGLSNFLRDLRKTHPDVFFDEEIRHPSFDKGYIYKELQPDGKNYKRYLNVRAVSAAIREAAKPENNPARAKKDVDCWLDFGKKIFGDYFDYELDTLAFMAQTGDRPGALLFLVGEPGVGKSTWIQFQSALFDGFGAHINNMIDGSKLLNEGSRRFILAGLEGNRITIVREMPDGKGLSPKDMATVTSIMKQVVDPGREGDFVTIEKKGENMKTVRNYTRIVISSNHSNAIHVDENDRRVFFIQSGMTNENKPGLDVYDHMDAIMDDPERLAAVWRWLLKRRISGFSRFTAPPITSSKAEAIALSTANPIARHLRAAIMLLQASGRRATTASEMLEIMSLMSERENANSNGLYDDRRDYTKRKNGHYDPAVMGTLRSPPPMLLSKATGLTKTRVNNVRTPTIYILHHHKGILDELREYDKYGLLDFIEAEEARELVEHPWEVYR